ncbi:hypothetical protein [Celerinatantimonas sp. MCCC 1A17872]|uniref:hypothetical protein n=1 Tax=Celerinatantimonas sp. MCCC 1A17872 TaxID=3177514 RepID=UPI0038CB5020
MKLPTDLTQTQQDGVKKALSDANFIDATFIVQDALAPLPQIFGTIAVAFYGYEQNHLQWEDFLNQAIDMLKNNCQWLYDDLLRFQHEYQAEPSDTLASKQAAFIKGIFAEELTLIEQVIPCEN